MAYEKHILALLDLPGYIDFYIKLLPDYVGFRNQGQRAFEATERIFFMNFGKNKYQNYETFKAAMSRYNKEKNQKKKEIDLNIHPAPAEKKPEPIPKPIKKKRGRKPKTVKKKVNNVNRLNNNVFLVLQNICKE